MNGFTITTVILLAIAVYTILAPGRADPVDKTTAPTGCTADNNCSIPPSVVPWPFDR